MQVSVIIPVHNRFNLADESIQSVYDQSHRPIELIIVDDKSDEPYNPKIRSQSGFEVILLRHVTNQGPGASRETGRLAAKGDFIAYMDSDDLWHPLKLEKQIALLQEQPNAGMCYCQSLVFSEWPLKGDEPFWHNSNCSFDRFLPIVLESRPWGTSACLWTREATEMIGPWHFGWLGEDCIYEVKAACQNIKIAYLPEICCYIRILDNASSLTTTESDFLFEQLWQSIEIYTSDIINSNLLSIDEIRKKLEIRLYKTARIAIRRKNRKIARQFLNYLQTITRNNEIWLYVFLLKLASYILPERLIDSIHYRKKHIILFNKSS